MPNIAVKCPICGKIKVNRRRNEQTTFYCCGIRHDLIKNMVAESVKKPRKSEGKMLKSKPKVRLGRYINEVEITD